MKHRLGSAVIFTSVNGAGLFAAYWIAVFLYGSPSNALGVLRGHPIVADVADVRLGTVAVGERAEVQYTLRNLSPSEPHSLVGIQLSCGCMSTELRPPVRLGPRKALSIPVTVRFPDNPERFRRHLLIHTDNPLQRFLELSVAADVVENHSGRAGGQIAVPPSTRPLR